MSVPQSTSKKDPNRVRRREKERLVADSASIVSVSTTASSSTSLAPSSISHYSQQPPPSQQYRSLQPPQQHQQLSPNPGGYNGSARGPSGPAQQQLPPPQNQRPLSYHGPPKPALMQAPTQPNPNMFARPLSSFDRQDAPLAQAQAQGHSAPPSTSSHYQPAPFPSPPPVPLQDQRRPPPAQQQQQHPGGYTQASPQMGYGGGQPPSAPPPRQYPATTYEQVNAFAGPSFSPPGGSTPAPSSSSSGYNFPQPQSQQQVGGASLTRVTTIGSAGGAMGSAQRLLGFSSNLRQMFRRTNQDQYLIRVMDVFVANLSGHVSRLVARELELTGQESRALESISRDFDKAAFWMEENQQNIAHIWPADRSAKALKDLDERLTKAFTSKLAVALFEAVQDTRHIGMQISRQIEGLEADLPGMIKRIVAQANSQTIAQTIQRLRVEEIALKPQAGIPDGYGGGEAEKTIQSLIDALETARLTQQEKEERSATQQRILGGGAANGSSAPFPSFYPLPPQNPPSLQTNMDSSARSHRSDNSSISYSTALLTSPNPLNSPGGGGGLVGAPGMGVGLMGGAHGGWTDDKKGYIEAGEGDGISFQPVDPISKLELVDPCLASDGYIHDRWTIITNRPEHPLRPGVPLRILGDVVQLRSAIFQRFPERRDEFLARRASYLVESISTCDKAFFSDIVDVLRRLSDVIAWQEGEEDTGILVRRALIRWRLRHLKGALADLLLALKLSPTLPIQHLLALIHLEMRSFPLALSAVESALSRDGKNAVAVAIRSIIHTSFGRSTEAFRDAAAAANLVNLPPPDYDASPQTSRDSKATYTPVHNPTPSSPLPSLLDIPYLLVGYAYLALSEPVRASVFLAKAVSFGPGGEPWARALWGYCLRESAEEGSTKEEGSREMEAAFKLAGDVGRDALATGGWAEEVEDLGKEMRPLKSAIALLLAQTKAKTDTHSACSMMVEAFATAHPLVVRTAEEYGFVAGLQATLGQFDQASVNFDAGVAAASKAGRLDEREGLLAERARFRF
ncbi:hypothetical protein BDY24DRAFT_395805 [Mrakia frigida]|uniref:uncharacterized protein n=1 Tax=Mrakia frigida TaxID=29902 RepID=UPI003FCC07C9